MMGPVARVLPDGRLHLQHGPSDLIVMAEGATEVAFAAAQARFATMIATVVGELAALRAPLTPKTPAPHGVVARRMHVAALPFAVGPFVTRMAAVAGAIADDVLDAMLDAAPLTRAYVNNGGDIALHLTPGATFLTAMLGHDGADLGRVTITADSGIRGIATSGRHGRSLSRGIADSVTVLAGSAARADVAATLIANAVDLPGDPAVQRRPACDIDPDSDLGARPVTVGCGHLSGAACDRALAQGRAAAMGYQQRGLIQGAGLFLQGRALTTVPALLQAKEVQHV